MAIERTFSIVKPDAVANNKIGTVVATLEAGGLKIFAQKMIRMTEAQAKEFYAVHKERPFYGDLVAFMTEGPCVVQVLEGDNAVARNRELMGATNPAEAAMHGYGPAELIGQLTNRRHHIVEEVVDFVEVVATQRR